MRAMKYLHTMIRVRDVDAALAFFQVLGLQEVRRQEVPRQEARQTDREEAVVCLCRLRYRR